MTRIEPCGCRVEDKGDGWEIWEPCDGSDLEVVHNPPPVALFRPPAAMTTPNWAAAERFIEECQEDEE